MEANSILSKLVVFVSKKSTHNILWGWLARLFSLPISFFAIHLITRKWGMDSLNIYFFILAMIGGMFILRLGIAIPFQNKLIENHHIRNSNSSLLSTVLLYYIFVPWVSIPIFYVLSNFLFYQYANIFNNSITPLQLTFSLFLGHFWINSEIVQKYFFYKNAEEKFYKIQSFVAIVSILYFFGLYTFCSITFIEFLFSFLLLQALPSLLALLYIPFRANFNISELKYLIKDSLGFFVFSILSFLTLNLDIFLVSKSFSGSALVEYNLINRLNNIIIIIITTVILSYSANFSRTFILKNLREFKYLILSAIKIQFIIIFSFSVFLVLFNEQFSMLLTSNKISQIDFGLIVSSIVYLIIRSITDTCAMALQAINQIKVLNYIVPIQAIISVVAQLLLIDSFGAKGAIIGIIISFLTTTAIILPLNILRRIKE